MITLDTTTQKLEAVLAGAVATTQPKVTVVWHQTTPIYTTDPPEPQTEVTTLNGATDVTILAAPPLNNYQRYIQSIHVFNSDTAPVTATVKRDDNGTETPLKKRTLNPGESLIYEHGVGWQEPIVEAPFIDTTAIVKGSDDSSKLLRIEVDGLTTGTTRVWTAADANIKPMGHATGLTATRIPYATGATGGVVTDSANLTFDGNGGLAIAGTGAGFSVADRSSGSGVAVFYRSGDLVHLFDTEFSGGANFLSFVPSTGLLCINDTSNANSTIGLTINQGAADDEILSLKSSDVAHGMTGIAETDTYGAFRKNNSDGTLLMRGLATNGARGIVVQAIAQTADTTKSTAAVGSLSIEATKRSGTGKTSVGADGNLVTILDDTTCRFIFDAEGSAHADVEWTTFDKFDDLLLLEGLDMEMRRRQGDAIKESFGEWVKESRDILQRERIFNFYDEGPRAMMNMTRMHMLQVGAIRQLGDALKAATQKIAELETKVRLLGPA